MSEKTGISWTDSAFNPWIGCSKISAGCTNCYAERDNKHYNWVEGGWGPAGHRKLTSFANWKKPIAWDIASKIAGVRHKVFCASLGDVFEDRPELVLWRSDLFDLIEATTNLDWLLLTKRPENVISMFDRHFGNYGEDGVIIPDNVWMGVTAENQEMANKRIPLLLNIPTSIRFVSIEPMLEAVDLKHVEGDHVYFDVLEDVLERSRFDFDGDGFGLAAPMHNGINWIICGGESGPNSRPMDISWARKLHYQCENAHIPFFFKQVGGNKRIDGHWGGDLLDGKQYHEFPKN
jgi:protein gp37